MAQAGTVWVDVRGDTKGLLSDIDAAARRAGAALNPLSVGKTVLGDLGRAAGVASVAVGGIAVAAIKTSADFNQAMSGVGAVAGATAAEMELLREAALKAGADTSFSASEAAEAQAELVKAGVAVSDVLGGALTGSLGLAAAGQLDLASAAEISAQAMNIFGLAGEDVGHIADVLAAGANKSAADVKSLGDALRQGGLVASQVGLSMEETVGVLSLFADNALIGSDAGTSLKTMLQRLTPQSDAAAEAMAELGLNFYDAQGAFVGIDEVAQQLQASLGGLSDEQRQAALTTLFGSDAVRAASLLMEGGKAAVDEYTDAVNDQGAATRMAAAQLDNLRGDLEEFSGATETALIRLGDLMDGANRAAVQSASGFVNVFNDFATTPAWDAIDRNISELADSFGSVFDTAAEQLDRFLSGISPTEVDRVFDRITGGVATARKSIEGMEGVVAGLGISLAGLGARSVLGPLGGIVPVISPITGVLGGLVLGSREGRDALSELAGEAAGMASSVGPELGRALSDLSGHLSKGLASAMVDVGGATLDAAEALGPVLGDAIREIGPPLGELIEEGGRLVSEVLPVIADLAGTVIPPAAALLGDGLGLAADAAGLLADNVWLIAPALAAFTASKHADKIGAIGSALSTAAENAGYLWRSVGDIAATQGVSKLEALGSVAKASGGDVKDLAGSLLGGLNPAIIGVTAVVGAGAYAWTTWRNNIREVEEAGEDLARDLIELGEDVLPRLAQQLTDTLDREEGWRDDFDKTGLSIAAVTEAINDNVGAMDGFRQEWNDAGKSLVIFRREGRDIPEGIRPIIETLVGLADAGVLTGSELNNVIDAMVDVDKNARTTGDSIGFMADQLKTALADEGIKLAGDALRDFNTAMNDNAPLDDRRGALARLADQYPDIAAKAGVAVGAIADGTADLANEADRAAGRLRKLRDELDELAGVERDLDEQQRRVNDSLQAVLDSYGRNGAGIDNNTEAGRRNADTIKGMVEEHEALAEIQATTDRTGQTSTATMLDLVAALGRFRDAGVITKEEYQELLDLYGLTPEEITTKIDMDTTQAKEDLEEYREELLAMPGVDEPLKAMILAATDKRQLVEIDYAISVAARNRTAEIDVVISRESFEKISQRFRDLQGQTVTRATRRVNPTRRASGGPVWPDELFLVGEKGPELVEFAQPGRVIDAQTSRQIADDQKAQSGTQFTDSLLERLIGEVAALRGELAAVGGSTVIDVRSDTSDGKRVGLDISDTLWLRGR